jgi:Mrp family chromosome partitioning ATPase
MMTHAETLAAAVPAMTGGGQLVALTAPDSPAAQQYRVLLRRLDQIAERRPLHVVAVTSASQGEGRTTTAANLALTAALDGRPTVLVEADLSRPALAEALGLASRAGLADLLAGTAEAAEAAARLGPLAVICAGQARDAGAALRSPRAGAVVEGLRAAYALVVLDAPPALAFADGDRLAAAADAALLVVRARVTPREVVRLALDALGDRAVGIVLNGVDPDASVHGRSLYPPAPAAAAPGGQ